MSFKCPFCELVSTKSSRIIEENDQAFVIRDGYPISEGHTLVIPKRHVGSFFDISNDERTALFELIESSKESLENEFTPDAFNIGINDGAAAGQTVAHLHIHLIPRYEGDIEDPRGGVRWIIPDKAVYWSDGK